MPSILIAGCGYVGEAAAALFHEAGWEVAAWTVSSQSADKLSRQGYAAAAVDISQREEVARQHGAFDAIIHCASSGGGGAESYRAVYLQGARNLLAVFPDTLLLFTSSTNVYAQTGGALVTEESSAEASRETARILRETEDLVLAHSGVVARLAGIYGPHRSALLQKFLSGEAAIDSAQNRYLNQVHRDDIASALFLLLNERNQTRGQIYNVVDDQPVLRSECLAWLASELNRPPPVSGPSAEVRKRGDSNKRVSNAKLRALGWQPRYSTFADAMRESILPAHFAAGG